MSNKKEWNPSPVLIIILAITIFGGCGLQTVQSTQQKAVGQETQDQARETMNQVTLWTYVPQFEQDMVSRFNSVHKDSEIDIVFVAADEIIQKFNTAWASNSNIPDIITFPNSVLSEMRNLNRLENLATEPYGFDKNLLIDNLQTLYLNNESTVSIPQSPSLIAMIYRRDLTNQYLGTDKPDEIASMTDTWDKFLQIALTIKTASEGQVSALSTLEGVWQVRFAQKDQPVATSNDLPVAMGYLNDLDWLKKFSDSGISWNLAMNSVEERETYKNGSTVFFLIPNWGIKGYMENYDKFGAGRWDIVPVPGVSCEYGGNSLGIPARASSKPEAWAYLDWAYNSVDGNLLMAKMTKSVPILKASFTKQLEDNSSSLVGTNLAAFWLKELAVVHIKTRSSQADAFSDAVLKNLAYMTEAGESAQALMQRAIQTMNQNLSE